MVIPYGFKSRLSHHGGFLSEPAKLIGDKSKCSVLGKPCRVKFKGTIYADVAELADALDSGSSECKFMWVQVPSSAP